MTFVPTTYTPGVPQATDLPSDNQTEFLANFTLLNQFFGVDHVPFLNGTSNGNGFHKKITFTNPTTLNPDLFTPTGIASLYTQVSNPDTTRPQLHYQNLVGAAFVSQLTKCTIVSNGAGGFGFKSPWGWIINFGQVFCDGVSAVLNYPVPYTSQVYIILNTPIYNPSIPALKAYTVNTSLTQFQSIAFLAVGINPIFLKTFYLAIGV